MNNTVGGVLTNSVSPSMPSRLCDLCGVRPADLRYREVTGWEEVRDQGGANKIIGRRETSRRACRGCIEKVRRGLSIEQGTML